MRVNIRSAQNGDQRRVLTRVAPDVSIHVLGYTSSTSPFHLHTSTINETHSIALVCVERFQRALEFHMIWARSIRGLTRLQAWQEFNKPSTYRRKIRVPRLSRWTSQRCRKARVSSERRLIPSGLPAPRERNRAQPSPVFALAIRACLDRRVDVSSARDSGQ